MQSTNDTSYKLEEYVRIHQLFKQISFNNVAKEYILSKRCHFDREKYIYPTKQYVRTASNLKSLEIESNTRKMPNFMTRRYSDRVRVPDSVIEANNHQFIKSPRNEYHYHMLIPLIAPIQFKGSYLWKERFSCFNPFCLKSNLVELSEENKCNWRGRCVGTVDGQCHIEEKGNHCKEFHPSELWNRGITSGIILDHYQTGYKPKMIQNFLQQRGTSVTLEKINDFLNSEKSKNIILDKKSEFNSLKQHLLRLKANNGPYNDVRFNDFLVFHTNLDEMNPSNY